MRSSSALFAFATLLLVACESTRVTRTREGEPQGLQRYREWGRSKVVQGAQPAGDTAFRNLVALGVTDILSVDGSLPEAARAETFGMHYYHVPIGYDGFTRAQALQIVKTVQQAKGKIYVHCHHGRHRGPTAAMIARIVSDPISNERAVHCMEESGTSPLYVGLYRDVDRFKAPSQEELSKTPMPPSRVLPEGLRAAMVDVSSRYESLKASKTAGWKVPADHPDISPPHEARMLGELFRETARLDVARKKGGKFLALLRDGEQAAVALEKALRGSALGSASRAYQAVKATCNACHSDFRN